MLCYSLYSVCFHLSRSGPFALRRAVACLLRTVIALLHANLFCFDVQFASSCRKRGLRSEKNTTATQRCACFAIYGAMQCCGFSGHTESLLVALPCAEHAINAALRSRVRSFRFALLVAQFVQYGVLASLCLRSSSIGFCFAFLLASSCRRSLKKTPLQCSGVFASRFVILRSLSLAN